MVAAAQGPQPAQHASGTPCWCLLSGRALIAGLDHEAASVGGSGAPRGFPPAGSSGSRALGPAELSVGWEAADPNGWPHVASSLSCSVIPEGFPHSLSQATGPRQKCRHRHVGGATAVVVVARPQAPCLLLPPATERNLHSETGARRYTRPREAHSRQSLDASPQLCVAPRPLWGGMWSELSPQFCACGGDGQ